MSLQRYPYNIEKLREARKGKKSAALCGFALTTRHLVDWDDPNLDIFGLNEAYKPNFMKRWTHWFQLHSEANFKRHNNGNDPYHYEWLKQAVGFPILMQKSHTEIPSSVRYPIEKYIDMFGRYATSTMAYMTGYAIISGYERIEYYGFEMATGTEYQNQRPCGEYMIGQALGRGIDVYLPPQCGLLKGPLYGYQNMSVGYRQQIEMRKQKLLQSKSDAIAHFNQMTGSLKVWQGLCEKEPENSFYKEQLNLQVEAYQNQAGLINKIDGMLEEAQNQEKLYDEYPFETEASDGWEEYGVEVADGETQSA